MIKVTIDNVTVETEEGTTILQAARKIGGKIIPPAMCYYSKLKGSGGKCRTCLVKVSQSSTKDPRPMPKLVASCSTPVQDGMVVQNLTSPEVIEARKGIVEFLLINHPLDCPVCDQAGECDLQDLSFGFGMAETATEEERREFPVIDIGDYIKLHMNRCILCYRCVYVADQLTDKRLHGVLYRGDVTEISTFISKGIENDFSGNMIDVCPVGALTDKTFRFKSRVWFLKPMNVHRDCPKCSGKAVAWMFGNEIYRITARKDKYGEVEDFICNECRFDKKNPADWVIEGPRHIIRQSVISANHYEKEEKPSVIKPIEGTMEKQK
ncbi:MAG: 2Fe-2S iron-sulfur cluster-binding protein [Bacteroidales bacterium]|jgi:NADH-quinone oxidoreductase subunit G|nr:2Fe-2S iron-sulfur cluster-binding protein [Bacteroidales bacterium]